MTIKRKQVTGSSGIVVAGQTKAEAQQLYVLAASGQDYAMMQDEDNRMIVTASSNVDMFNPFTGEQDLVEVQDSGEFAAVASDLEGQTVSVNYTVCASGCGAHIISDADDLSHCPSCSTELQELSDDEIASLSDDDFESEEQEETPHVVVAAASAEEAQQLFMELVQGGDASVYTSESGTFVTHASADFNYDPILGSDELEHSQPDTLEFESNSGSLDDIVAHLYVCANHSCGHSTVSTSESAVICPSCGSGLLDPSDVSSIESMSADIHDMEDYELATIQSLAGDSDEDLDSEVDELLDGVDLDDEDDSDLEDDDLESESYYSESDDLDPMDDEDDLDDEDDSEIEIEDADDLDDEGDLESESSYYSLSDDDEDDDLEAEDDAELDADLDMGDDDIDPDEEEDLESESFDELEDFDSLSADDDLDEDLSDDIDLEEDDEDLESESSYYSLSDDDLEDEEDEEVDLDDSDLEDEDEEDEPVSGLELEEDADDMASESSVIDEIEVDLLQAIAASEDLDSSKIRVAHCGNLEGEATWVAFYGKVPVAMSSLASVQSEPLRAVFNDDKFGQAFTAAVATDGVEAALQDFGFERINPEIEVEHVVEQAMMHRAEARVREVEASFNEERTQYADRYMAALATASLGINRGVFKDLNNPIAARLLASLSQAGVKNAADLIQDAFVQGGNRYNEMLISKAAELVAKPLETQNEIAEMVANASDRPLQVKSFSVEDRLSNWEQKETAAQQQTLESNSSSQSTGNKYLSLLS